MPKCISSTPGHWFILGLRTSHGDRCSFSLSLTQVLASVHKHVYLMKLMCLYSFMMNHLLIIKLKSNAESSDVLQPWQRPDLVGPTEVNFVFGPNIFWIKKRGERRKLPRLWFYVVVRVMYDVRWCSVVKTKAERCFPPPHTNRTAATFFIITALLPCVSFKGEPLFRPCWRKKRSSLPPWEKWLTCSLIYSQWVADDDDDDGPGCARRGQGYRWCDPHNKEHHQKTVCDDNTPGLSDIGSW